MKVTAPGKLLIAGAYAVLDGSPALVVAVDRHAVADGDTRAAKPTPEVLAAMAADDAPAVDASALREGEHKLGLGSSAAMLVASLGVCAARRGEDLADESVRFAILSEARKAHALVQHGGSGVDVAASVYGGAVEYVLAADGTATVRATPLPPGLVLDVFWTGTPATTTDMRGRVDAYRHCDPRGYASRIDAIADAARAAIDSARRGELPSFNAAARDGARALMALGESADAPIYPPRTLSLVRAAEEDGAVFMPSGAGGGDVFVHIGSHAASRKFIAHALAADIRPISMHQDPRGVRLV